MSRVVRAVGCSAGAAWPSGLELSWFAGTCVAPHKGSCGAGVSSGVRAQPALPRHPARGVSSGVRHSLRSLVTLHAASSLGREQRGPPDTFAVTLASEQPLYRPVPPPRVVPRAPHTCRTMWQLQYSCLRGNARPQAYSTFPARALGPAVAPHSAHPPACVLLGPGPQHPLRAPPSVPKSCPSPQVPMASFCPHQTPIETTVLARILEAWHVLTKNSLLKN